MLPGSNLTHTIFMGKYGKRMSSENQFHYRVSCCVKCSCHNIPGCRMCSECFKFHNLTQEQWDEHMSEFVEREKELFAKREV